MVGKSVMTMMVIVVVVVMAGTGYRRVCRFIIIFEDFFCTLDDF
jgi:hypothetical protein